MPTQLELKKRDLMEQELKLSELQYNTLKNNCLIFYNNVAVALAKYEKWLKEHEDVQPQLNLEYYRKIQ